jgi:hypothetical protein
MRSLTRERWGEVVAGGGEDARERGGGAALAVGSGDEDRGEGELGVAEGCGEGAHVGEVELAARRGWGCGGQLVAEGVEMVDRCGVGHGGILGDVGGRPRICAEDRGFKSLKTDKSEYRAIARSFGE